MIPGHFHDRLHRLYELRARVDAEIARAEAELRLTQQRKLGGRQRRRRGIEHGTNAGYQWHLRRGVPFPEDTDDASCGCRESHAAYVAAATRRRKVAQRLGRAA